MNSLASRGVILAFARLMQLSVLMLSPILLVRLMSITDYGRYRQFVVVTIFAATIAQFSVRSNVNYFVARSSEHSAAYVTNSCFLMLVTATIAAFAFLASPDLLVPREIRNYSAYLAAYVFLWVNCDVFAAYSLAIRRADRVLYYSLALVVVRLGAVVGSTAWSGDLGTVFLAMLSVECVHVLGVLVWMLNARLLKWRLDMNALREQLRFILPAGSGNILDEISGRIGSLLVGGRLGPEPLAIYTIASYKMPIITILRSGLSDAIFPDMVLRSTGGGRRGFDLWRRTNVVFLMFVMPAWVMLTWYAADIVRVLFTEAYIAATPYFLVLLPLMIRECFDFSAPLRSVANTRPMVTCNAVALVMNIAVISLCMSAWGIWAVIAGLWVAKLVTAGYLGWQVMRTFRVELASLLDWWAWSRIVAACLIAFVAMVIVERAAQLAEVPEIVTGIAGIVTFGTLYALALRQFDISEARFVVQQMIAVVRRFTRQRRGNRIN